MMPTQTVSGACIYNCWEYKLMLRVLSGTLKRIGRNAQTFPYITIAHIHRTQLIISTINIRIRGGEKLGKKINNKNKPK